MSYHPQTAEATLVIYPTIRPLIDFVVRDDGTGPYYASWTFPQPQPTEQQILDAVPLIPGAYTTATKNTSKDVMDSDGFGGRVQRAEAKLIVDELNILRKRTRDTEAAIQAAISLADLKTRMAALVPATLVDRTLQQAVSAIKANIDAE